MISDFPLHIEVKFTKNLTLKPFCEQAERDAQCERWIVMHKQNRKPWLCIVRKGIIAGWYSALTTRVVTKPLSIWTEFLTLTGDNPVIVKDGKAIMYATDFFRLWNKYEKGNE